MKNFGQFSKNLKLFKKLGIFDNFKVLYFSSEIFKTFLNLHHTCNPVLITYINYKHCVKISSFF